MSRLIQRALFEKKEEAIERTKPKSPRKSVKRTATKTPKSYDCDSCGLRVTCKNPKMVGFGSFEKDVMIIGEAPGKLEDDRNRPFVGRSGELLKGVTKGLGWNLDRDIYRSNVIRCRPPDNKLGTKAKASFRIICCKKNLEEEIDGLKPKLIIVLGNLALEGVLGKRGIFQHRGYMIPSKRYHTIVCPTVHPAYILRGNEDLLEVFVDDISKFLSEGLVRAKDIDSLLDWKEDEDNYNITDFEGFRSLMCMIIKDRGIINVDFETNGLRPYAMEEPKILTCSMTLENGKSFCFPIEKGDYWRPDEKVEVKKLLGKVLSDKNVGKVIQNVQFELMWSRILGCEINNIVADTMIDAHLLNPRGSKKENGKFQKGSTSQAFQVFTEYGYEYKDMVNQSKSEFEPDDKVFLYNNRDTKYAARLYFDREEKMKGKEKARGLFLAGQKIFSDMEFVGVRIDENELNAQEAYWNSLIEVTKESIWNSEEGVKFRDSAGRDLKIVKKVSSNDMKKLLFDILKVEVKHRTEKGNPTFTEESMQDYLEEVSLCGEIIKLNKYTHHKSTYLDGIQERLVNGRVHPSLNLHMVDTFRSSCNDPNLQNIPKRDPETKKVRKIILPDEGQWIGEVDYKQLEVSVATMFSKDPVLVDSLSTGFDMHSFWAQEIFKTDSSTKDQRYNAKNKWVFPQFYGSNYKSCMRNFVKIEDFTNLFLDRNKKFNWKRAEKHLKECEIKFWETYVIFKQWRDDQVKFYESKGYIETLWGFRRPAPLSRNKIINTSIQGHAFHLLLDSMIIFIDEMKRRKMKSRAMFEVHDSCVFSIEPEEKEELVELVSDVMCMTSDDYDFINVPLKVEWEFSKTNWYDIKEE